MKPLFTEPDWNFELIHNAMTVCGELGKELKLNTYRNQIEVIGSEQMLDAHASNGLPIMYKHWSFGKKFSRERDLYKAGKRGLAYEIVINSNPCISYLMEENSACMQVLVIAHAAYGHNHFMKNNYLFKQWTDAEGILDYLQFAKNYISSCEERYGVEVVEDFLNSVHALQMNGLDRARKPHKLNLAEEKERVTEREAYLQKQVNDLWRTVPSKGTKKEAAEKRFPEEPQENVLYFLEKNSPILETWQREVIRIVRKISQYFYPQYQTKVMNEGWACFTHHYLMNRMWEEGYLTEGAFLEFIRSHTSVVWQPDYDHKYFSGINPYYLGFEMFQDIKRICSNPSEEDKHWFPDLVNTDWLDHCLYAVENFRDESFIRQYLSPTLIRKMRLFTLDDHAKRDHFIIDSIHNEEGYKRIRSVLASSYEVDNFLPQIYVTNANIKTDRTLTLEYRPVHGRDLKGWKDVGTHLYKLWGHKIIIEDNQGHGIGTIG